MIKNKSKSLKYGQISALGLGLFITCQLQIKTAEHGISLSLIQPVSAQDETTPTPKKKTRKKGKENTKENNNNDQSSSSNSSEPDNKVQNESETVSNNAIRGLDIGLISICLILVIFDLIIFYYFREFGKEINKLSSLKNNRVNPSSNNNQNNAIIQQQLESQLDDLKRRLTKLENLSQQNNNYSSPSNTNPTVYPQTNPTVYPQPNPTYTQPTIISNPPQRTLNPSTNISSPEAELVSRYNQNRASLSREATVVSESQESINERRLDQRKPVIFEANQRGNYWIINAEGSEYLIPKSNMKINEYNYETVSALFICSGYNQNSGDFQLRKPAKVMTISSGKTWQVLELGELIF